MSDCWPIRTVVFDLDDTLYSEKEYVMSGFAAAEQWLMAQGRPCRFAATAAAIFQQGVRGTVFDRALDQLFGSADPGTVAALVSAYRAHRPNIRLLPDAEFAIAWARENFSTALVTDGFGAVQSLKIQALNLHELISTRIITDDLGREFWKPHPLGFQTVMQQLGGAAPSFVYIADNPRKDFIGPRRLGWRTIRIRRPDGEHAAYMPDEDERAELEIASLAELPHHIRPMEEPC